MPASVFYGMVTPYVIKLSSRKDMEGQGSGNVFALSTAGSISGTLLSGFLLIPNISLSTIFVGTAAVMLFGAWFIGRAVVPETAIFLLVALPLSTLTFTPIIDGELLYHTSSEYYEINVYNITENNSMMTVLMLDNVFSSGQDSNRSRVFGYVEKERFAYSIVNNPKRALVLGVAAGTQIEDLKAYFPYLIVDGVEIDSKTVDVGKQFFSLSLDNRTNIHIDDGRRYIKKCDNTYDIVLIDAYKGMSIPYHMASAEFLQELKKVMSNESIVVFNVIGTLKGSDSKLFEALHVTYDAAFSDVVVMPLDRNNPDKLQNIVFVASDMNLSSFRSRYASEIYLPESLSAGIITDDLNPTETFVISR